MAREAVSAYIAEVDAITTENISSSKGIMKRLQRADQAVRQQGVLKALGKWVQHGLELRGLLLFCIDDTLR